MNPRSFLLTHPLQTLAVAATGFCGYLIASIAGLHRWGGFESNTAGLILGMISGFFWYLAAVIPLLLPDRFHLAATLNSVAASTATGAVCYLIPDATALAIRSMF
jgi:hypothetical protein